MDRSDRLIDVMLREETGRLNAHLPKSRRTIAELLIEETPEVNTVDGNRIVMKKPELEELAAALPKEARDRVRLPIVLLRRSDLGPGAFTLLGDAFEHYAISRLVKGFHGTYEEFKQVRKDATIIYKPEVSELVRRYHSLVVMGFGASEEKVK